MKSKQTETIRNSFTTVCCLSNSIQSVQIKEVDMLGWTLFECFISPETMVYFSQEDINDSIIHIDMGDKVPDEWRDTLLSVIQTAKSKESQVTN